MKKRDYHGRRGCCKLPKIKVMVVDDSAFMRKVIKDMLEEDPDIEVVATARDGMDAIKKLVDIRPDVITLDLEMPRLNGLDTLGYIMSETPTPVIMLSSYTQEGADATLRALDYGAVDFVPKPSGPISMDIRKVKDELIRKIKSAVGINLSVMKFKEISPIKKKKEVKSVPYLKSTEKILVIGTSTGGPRALQEVVPKIPADIESGILIVQHMPPKFTKSLAERLDSLSELVVKEAEDGDKVSPGVALVAPGDYHMIIERDGKEFRVRNVKTPPIGKLRPAVDVTMLSVAEVWNGFIVGVIMTGMGKDGAKGMLMIKKRGGRTIVEDKSTCVVYGMPRAVVEIGAADIIVPLYEIPKKIVEVIKS